MFLILDTLLKVYLLTQIVSVFYTTCYLLKNFSGAPRGLPIYLLFFLPRAVGCGLRAVGFALRVILLFYYPLESLFGVFPFCWGCKGKYFICVLQILFFLFLTVGLGFALTAFYPKSPRCNFAYLAFAVCKGESFLLLFLIFLAFFL